jgi:jumonji domain-containing protein 7
VRASCLWCKSDLIRDPELLGNYHDINPQSVTELTREPTPLEFMRFVSRNQPFVIRSNTHSNGGTLFQKTVERWNVKYLSENMRDKKITVAITPSGNADSVVPLPGGGSIFCKPYEVKEPFSEAVQMICAQEKAKIHGGATRYIQSQNDNLRSEYVGIFADVPETVPWASIALQQEPDAVNFWLGNSHSVSVLHKDHYENIFTQICGQKEFVLLPPVEAPCVNERSVLSATYTPRDDECILGSWDLGKNDLWIKVDYPEEYIPLPTWDPENPMENTTPYSKYSRPIRVTVNPGDILYLPALWYHKVKQRCGDEGICCSVNYWYDMEFAGSFQCTNKLVQDVASLSSQKTD